MTGAILASQYLLSCHNDNNNHSTSENATGCYNCASRTQKDDCTNTKSTLHKALLCDPRSPRADRGTFDKYGEDDESFILRDPRSPRINGRNEVVRFKQDALAFNTKQSCVGITDTSSWWRSLVAFRFL